jgi:acetyl esterase/lipase
MKRLSMLAYVSTLALLAARCEAPVFAAAPPLSYGASPQQTITPCLPAGAGPWPGVLVVHGGGWTGLGTGIDVTACQAFAAAGLAAFNVSYRLASGTAAEWPAQTADLTAAHSFIATHAAALGVANPASMCGVGFSAGGHLVSFLAATGELACVVDNYGPADMVTIVNQPLRDKFQSHVAHGAQPPADCPAGSADWWCLASPVYSITPASSPMLLVYGLTDATVPPQQGTELDAALTAAGVPHNVIWYAGGHSFGGVGAAGVASLLAQEAAYMLAELSQ